MMWIQNAELYDRESRRTTVGSWFDPDRIPMSIPRLDERCQEEQFTYHRMPLLFFAPPKRDNCQDPMSFQNQTPEPHINYYS